MPLALKKNSNVISKNDIVNYVQNELWNVVSTDIHPTAAKSFILNDASKLLEMDESDLYQQIRDSQSQKTITVLQYERDREMINYPLPEHVVEENPHIFIKTRPINDDAIETLSHISRFSIASDLTDIAEVFEDMSNPVFNELINSPVNMTLTYEFETMQPLTYTYAKEYVESHESSVNASGLMSHINTIITLYKLLV